MTNNTFINNHAPYGNDIASYPVLICEEHTCSSSITLDNVPSGLTYEGTINLKLVDFDGQIISTENENTAKILAVTPSVSVGGINYAKFVNGSTSLNKIILNDWPGSKNTEYRITSQIIDKQQVMTGLGIDEDTYDLNYTTKVNVSFRFCKLGEIISSDGKTCQQ